MAAIRRRCLSSDPHLQQTPRPTAATVPTVAQDWTGTAIPGL